MWPLILSSAICHSSALLGELGAPAAEQIPEQLESFVGTYPASARVRNKPVILDVLSLTTSPRHACVPWVCETGLRRRGRAGRILDR